MKKNKISRLLTTVLLISGTCSTIGQDWNKEFKIDKNTLLLAHYNQGLDADYALGNPGSTGNVQLTDGKFGRGIYASNGTLKQENLLGSPFFRMLRYSHVGNFNINQGTIEMWVKPSMNQIGRAHV